MKNRSRNDLIRFLLDGNAVFHSDDKLRMKSGVECNFDTDIRRAMGTVRKLMSLAALIYRALPATVISDRTAFIGVPETGHLLSLALSIVHAEGRGTDALVNLIRVSPKPYQESSTTNTVLPLATNAEYILVEDDVVSGTTLAETLKRFSRDQFACVVSVIDRGGDVSANLEKHSSAEYFCCAPLMDILREVSARGNDILLQAALEDYFYSVDHM
jgi:hypothetical protein